jgi:hypothetical protein
MSELGVANFSAERVIVISGTGRNGELRAWEDRAEASATLVSIVIRAIQAFQPADQFACSDRAARRRE